MSYTYDALGRVNSHNIDGANSIAAQFDSLGRVTAIANPLGQFSYAYVNTTARIKSLTYPLSTGLVSSLTYFPNVSPSGTGNGDERLQQISNRVQGTILSQFSYSYNPVGTIATWAQQADTNVTNYNLTYDLADQLTSAAQMNSSGASLSSDAFSYDPNGNRLQEAIRSGTTSLTTSGKFNALNQLTTYPGPGQTTVSGKITATTPASVTVNGNPATLGSGTPLQLLFPCQ